MKKSELLERIRDEPEDCDSDKLIYTMWFRRRLELARARADEDKGMSQEELEKWTDSWLE